MTDARWLRVEQLFEAVADLPPAARDAALADEPDTDVVGEVRALLAADTSAGAFFGALAAGLAHSPAVLDAGVVVGAYRVEAFVGEGGMGSVYRAVRADGAFDRTVALKVMRVGTGDVRRFLGERSVLARLDHPAIARLYDGGVLPDGRPYFAMEWVEGRPITDYAAEHALDVDARLELFVQVCEAVQYAHGRLIVHRDLKPSNVLVADTPDGPRVSLLDFGIARALDADALTEPGGAAPMTPAYAAPEQLLGEPVSTATDVYALGVLLYELLTGRRPYRVASRARAAVERAILDTQPTRPSTAVTHPEASDGPPSAAPPATGTGEQGATRLARRLAGDLDAVLLKALEKEPARRYGSAEAFARDLRRHLRGMPVHARPPSAAYLAGRFLRRHRVGAALAVLTVALVVGWATTATLQGRRLAAERDRARLEAVKAERVTAFVTDLFHASDPALALGGRAYDPGLTARDVLDRGLARASLLHDEPGVQAEMLATIAQTYTALGAYDAALAPAQQALALRTALARRGDVRAALDAAESLRALGWLHILRGETRAAAGRFQEALAIYDTHPEAPPAERAEGLLLLGEVMATVARHSDALRLYSQALALYREAGDGNGEAVTLHNLGSLHHHLGRFDASISLYRRAIALSRRQPRPDSVAIGASHTLMGLVLREAGRLDESEEALTTARELIEPRLPSEHFRVLQSRMAWGTLLVAQRRFPEAVATIEPVLNARRKVLGRTHWATAEAEAWLGVAYLELDRLDEAEALLESAYRVLAGVRGPDDRYVVPIAEALDRVEAAR